MNKIYNFIIKERIYLLMLLFILLFNITNAPSKKAKEGERKEKLATLQQKLKGDFSLTQEKLKEELSRRPRLALLVSFLSISASAGFIAGVFLFIGALLKLVRRAEILPRNPAAEHGSWEMLDIARVSIVIFFSSYIAAFMLSAVFTAFKIKNIDGHSVMLLDTTIVDLSALAGVLCFVWAKYKKKAVSLGLSLNDLLKNIKTGISGYLTLLPLLVIILIFVIQISQILKYEPPVQQVMDLFVSEKRSNFLIYSSLFVAFFGPICEEVFFRGFAYSALRNKLGIKPAILITSAVFGALHGNMVAFFPIMALGCLLAYLYEKTGSLIPSITVHIIHNSALVGLIFLFKELKTL